MGCISSTSSKSKSDGPAKRNTAPAIKAGVAQLKLIYNINPKVLGSGSFGKVFLAENKADPTFKVAIKVISKQKLT